MDQIIASSGRPSAQVSIKQSFQATCKITQTNESAYVQLGLLYNTTQNIAAI